MEDLLTIFWQSPDNEHQEQMNEAFANMMTSQSMARYEQGCMVRVLNDWLGSIGIECVISCDNIHMDGFDYTIESGCEEIIKRIEGDK